jgi:hypothetical protein
MTTSEKLYQLADRAKSVEARIDTAKDKTEAELRVQVAQARETSQRKAAELKASAENAEQKASSWWGEAQTNWDAHVGKVRAHLDDIKADQDVKRAEHRAERAEFDADAAVAFAAAALEEAEYAALDAALARMEADAAVAAR